VAGVVNLESQRLGSGVEPSFHGSLARGHRHRGLPLLRVLLPQVSRVAEWPRISALADGSWSALLARLALALEPAIPAPGASAIPAAFTPSVARAARRDAPALTQSHPCTADEFSRYISVIHSRVSKDTVHQFGSPIEQVPAGTNRELGSGMKGLSPINPSREVAR
jgi:hypothetical protein